MQVRADNEGLLIALAVAHNWYTGYHDPVTGYECCDDKKDCGVINPRFVEPLPGGGFNVRTDSGSKAPLPILAGSCQSHVSAALSAAAREGLCKSAIRRTEA